jgi:hypothetical protein
MSSSHFEAFQLPPQVPKTRSTNHQPEINNQLIPRTTFTFVRLHVRSQITSQGELLQTNIAAMRLITCNETKENGNVKSINE